MRTQKIHRRLIFVLQSIMVLEVIFAVWRQEWLTVVITMGIILITLSPLFLEKLLGVLIPAEFVLLAVVFIFASLFLGEVHGYYSRFWWWDIALHSGSGFLLGIVGFLLVYLLNETERIGVYMKPGFVAFFAFLFAIGMGSLWEIFEFAMDSFFGTNMQKEMLGDVTGLTDTMFDMIVNTLGALIIALMGYSYLKSGRKESFLERWISRFIESNPSLFKGTR